MSLLKELKRRNVFKVTFAYIVMAWLVLQVADVVLNNITAPGWIFKVLMLFLAIGLPFAVFFAWAFELTPDGLKREHEVDRTQSITPQTGKKLNVMITAVLILALGYFAYDKFVLSSGRETVAIESAVEQATSQALTEQAATAESSSESDRSIAVLPFVNMSDDAANEYFSDGLSEEILNLLAKVSGLKVIARTSSFAFKGKNQDLRQVGEALGVKNVLEGSVRKSGERVRITAQLIAVTDGSHIWSETYDRTLTDIFQIQDDVAAAIVDALKIHVGADPTRGRPTDSTEAYDLFLQARVAGVTSGRAIRYLQAAIALDPKFAEAYELLAINYWNMAGTAVKSNEGQRLTFEAAEQALALDPSLAMARALARSADLENYSWQGEILAFEQVLQEQPGNTDALNALSFDLLEAGYLQEAVKYAERLIALDPLSDGAKFRFSESLVSVGRREEAMTSAYSWLLGDLYVFSGQYTSAADQYSSFLKPYFGFADTTWVRDAVEKGRDPVAGQDYLEALIADKLAGLPDDKRFDLWRGLVNWYPVFGHLDRYLQIIQSLDLTSSTWTDADWVVYVGTIERAYTGFTAHPDYIKVAESIGLLELWNQRGAPDFCHKEGGNWICE